ncbi:MAG: 4-alpha-glucanotransferase [Planctomycetota bacterium]
MAGETRALSALADLLGVQRSYVDLDHRRQRASTEALLAVTAALGAGIEAVAEAPEALRRLQAERSERVVEPVVASFGPRASRIPLQMTAPLSSVRVLAVGEGETTARELLPIEIVSRRSRCELLLPKLPLGYHRLSIEVNGRTHETLLVRAPQRAPAMAGGGIGMFLPLHALREDDDLGIGNFGGLRRLAEWCGSQGGTAVSTLPLLATNLDEPFEFSPYSPLSRCFWNEVFLDVNAVPELAACEPARKALANVAERARTLRAQKLVDYRASVELVRAVLQPLAKQLAALPGPRGDSFRTFRKGVDVTAYARFRAVQAARGEAWQAWPAALQAGRFGPDSFDPELETYHAYTQWLAEEQLVAAREAGERCGVKLYLDLPLGVHPAGFDTFLHRDLFVSGVAAGAPPDPLFSQGQNWGFPPPHPERQREQGYRHLIDVLRHHMRHAKLLRLDHVMGLHRLFCIPSGMAATAGVYVKYPADEMFAIVCLEASRAGCHVVGEDLGTVPPMIRSRMRRHGLSRLHVFQFSIDPSKEPPVHKSPAGAAACLNTHDMPTFAGFLAGNDLQDQRELGLIDDAALAAGRSGREHCIAVLKAYLQRRGLVGATSSPHDVMRGAQVLLAEGDSELLLLNLEDLWLEPLPQNIPGTWRERPNWRRRAAVSLAEMCERSGVLEVLRASSSARRERSAT